MLVSYLSIRVRPLMYSALSTATLNLCIDALADDPKVTWTAGQSLNVSRPRETLFGPTVNLPATFLTKRFSLVKLEINILPDESITKARSKVSEQESGNCVGTGPAKDMFANQLTFYQWTMTNKFHVFIE